MKKLTLSAIVLLLCASPCASQTPDVEKVIRALGPSTTRADLRVLRESPRRAVELLLRDLTTIPDEKILPDAQAQHTKAIHVIWSIRALRYLTRQEFRAPTAHVFGDTENEQTRHDLLSAHGTKTVAFFAEWMSRGSIYIAPTDAQIKIISDWRTWYAREGQTWRLGPEPDFNEWYF